MAILDAFGDGTDRLEPPQVAARIGISAPTAYRLMGAMAEHRLLGTEGRGFRLGSRLLQLGARASDGVEVRGIALPLMKELRDATGETVELQVLVGHTRVPVEMVVGLRTVRTAGQIGVPLPTHLGASSRVLLAWLDESTALALAARSAADHPGTSWDPDTYRHLLRLVRAQGWEFSARERDPESSAVSVPIRDRHDDVIAALVVSGTATRLADQAHRSVVIERARTAATVISAELGCDASSPTPQESIA
ncbi:IclR family transcriptional regulator [Modestobacter sp. VKM Ac-2982]|nr:MULTISPECIES: IclR family transcriptional regulator [unclassified Modestobacter]MCZ2826101.1 IclR family transcriptional regulator [Modestobacter sp. VKM Ac-2981]MCZ2852834.1 IclR family transcriptional regulator [Modestobacter sp. VKM Ac-2982]